MNGQRLESRSRRWNPSERWKKVPGGIRGVGSGRGTHLLLHLLGVLGDDTTLDVALESLGVEGLVLEIVAGVALVVVGDVEATIHSTLERGEHAGSGGGAHEAGVEVALERTAVALSLDVVILAEVLGVTLVGLREVVLGQKTTRAEESGGVGGGIVGEASLHPVLGELVRVRRADGHVSLDGGVDHLADHIAVGEADGEPVLGGVVLVLVLEDQALAGIVVRLACGLGSQGGKNSASLAGRKSKNADRGSGVFGGRGDAMTRPAVTRRSDNRATRSPRANRASIPSRSAVRRAGHRDKPSIPPARGTGWTGSVNSPKRRRANFTWNLLK